MARRFRRNLFTDKLEEFFDDEEPIRVAPREKVSLAYSQHKPLKSVTGGCHPSQAKTFNEIIKQEGRTGVHYDEKTGDVTFDSRAARNAELKRRNMLDGDAGYGDWAGN